MAASGSPQSPHADPQPQGDAYAVVDAAGQLLHWSPGAERLLGYSADEILGTAATGLLGEVVDTARLDTGRSAYLGTTRLRRRDGDTVEAALWATPLSDTGTGTDTHTGIGWLLQAACGDTLRRAELDHALVDGLFTESPVVIGVFDTGRRFLALNRAGRSAWGFTEIEGRTLREVAPPGLLDLDAFEERQRTVLETGEALMRERVEGAAPPPSRRRMVWSETVLPLRGAAGELIGLAHILVDNTRQEQAQRRLRLVNEAGVRTGGRLDVRDIAQRLVDFAVGELCDYAHLDLFEDVFGIGGPDADAAAPEGLLRRAASASAAGAWSPRRDPDAGEAGVADPFASAPGGPALRAIDGGRPLLLTGERWFAAVAAGADASAAAARDHVRSWLAVPLYVRDVPLGVAVFVRFAEPHGAVRPFDRDEVVTAWEIVQRVGIVIDQARRVAGERARFRDLQRGLLPQRLLDVGAVDVAYRYLPSRAPSGLGGAWYDFIRLSGARMALVVGDVAGEGMHAAVYVGRVRTATRVLADQDLTPEEVLTALDALVRRFTEDFAHTGSPVGSTCLFVTFDPIKGELSLASAGHPVPAIGTADHGARAVDMPIGHAFGVHGTPYEGTVVPWADGDVLVLGTKGLGTPAGDAASGALPSAWGSLASLPGPQVTQADLSVLCDRLIDRLTPSGRICDAVLMAARLRRLESERYISWDLESDPEEVGRARTLATGQLHVWGLADLDFGTELIVSELVTNALRYGTPPIRLRLIRDQGLTCEVTDRSSTSPHVRHAADNDEGGRGLYMVAQVADLWGTRYHDRGKTIWARQPLPGAA